MSRVPDKYDVDQDVEITTLQTDVGTLQTDLGNLQTQVNNQALNDLTDCVITAPQINDLLTYQAGQWVNLPERLIVDTFSSFNSLFFVSKLTCKRSNSQGNRTSPWKYSMGHIRPCIYPFRIGWNQRTSP